MSVSMTLSAIIITMNVYFFVDTAILDHVQHTLIFLSKCFRIV